MSNVKKSNPIKSTRLIVILILITALWSCNREEVKKGQNYIFVKKYCATVIVGGVVGIAEKYFNVSDVVVGYKKTQETITIRIAKHSPLNDGQPNSASYQEYLDVPSDYLK